jgi:L-ascorbate metabolism protein UlaG (beta-lactamase superfamily)
MRGRYRYARAVTIPDGATFRRAEGLWFTVAPCAGTDEIRVTARRQGADVTTMLASEDVRLLARLSVWRTAAELGVAQPALEALVAARCAYWSTARHDHVLTGGPLDRLDGAIALGGNVLATPLIAIDGRLGAIPHMPRLGTLDDARFGGLRLDVYEWETVVASVTIGCCARHAAVLRDLVVGLDGRQTVAALAPDDDTRAILAALDDLGLLARHQPPPRDATARVTWLAHAGILYEAAGRRIAIDPIVFPRSDPTRHAVRPFDARDLGDLDAVLITHGDSDHLVPAALIRLARSTPIYLPRPETPRPFHVDMKRMLAVLGFTAVTEVDAWQAIAIGEVTAVAAPFRGEDWGLPLPCRTWVVSAPELTIYANADALGDDATLDRIAREHAIDVAFVGVTGAAESHAAPPGFGYGHFYAPWIPEAEHDRWVELCNGPRAAAAAAVRVGARFAFGYAAGGAPFTTIAYSDRGTHAEMAAHLGAGPTRPLPFEVGVPVGRGTLDR